MPRVEKATYFKIFKKKKKGEHLKIKNFNFKLTLKYYLAYRTNTMRKTCKNSGEIVPMSPTHEKGTKE